MKKLAIIVALTLFPMTGLSAPDAKVVKPDAAVKAPASQPASQPAANIKLPDQAPKDAGEALATGSKVVEAVKTKNWFAASAGLIWLLMFLLKSFGLFRKIGKRWAYIVVPVLSLAAMLLSKFAGDLSWAAAFAVMTSGPTAALLNDFVKRGVLGKEPVTNVKG